jgi:LysR family nitrogen assimilation transcriptional regulator
VDVRQIRYFLKIAEKRSFTKAAEHLGVAQPALGLQIRKLEDELEVQLFVRHPKGVELTEAGRMLVERGRRIMDDFSDTRAAMAALRTEPAGRIAVGVTPSLADCLVIPLMRRAAERIPDMRVQVVEGLSAVLSTRVRDGQLDFAVGYDMSPGPGLTVRRLGSDHVCLIEAAEDAAGKPATAEFSEISGRPLVLPPMPHRVRELVEAAARERKVTLKVAHEIHSAGTALRLVEEGFGAALSGVAAFRPQMAGRALVARPLVNPSPIFEFGLIHAEARSLTASELEFIGIIETLLSETTGVH